jgi:hypothetical protein
LKEALLYSFYFENSKIFYEDCPFSRDLNTVLLLFWLSFAAFGGGFCYSIRLLGVILQDLELALIFDISLELLLSGASALYLVAFFFDLAADNYLYLFLSY